MFCNNLNGKWLMKETSEEKWIEAYVPGDMYNDLLSTGTIENPFYRENEQDALKLSFNDYEYKRNFIVSSEFLKNDIVLLTCEGLDTLAEIKVNGRAVGNTNNMYRKYEFNVKDILLEGNNEIYIKFSSPAKYVEEKHRENPLCHGKDSLQGIYYLRKAHCMFGWDWGPKLPNMGIWKDIYLKAYNNERIKQVYITQNHELKNVYLDIKVEKEIWTQGNSEIQVEIKSPKGEKITKRLEPNSIEDHIDFHIENPELWWPNGYGEQPLYEVVVKLIRDKREIDIYSQNIGLRTITVNQEKDQWGQSFEVVVNGVPLFLMGADYIPEDNLLGRCSKEKTEILLKDCIKANFNCIRVWGGGYYPQDYFFELCDKLGLLVWQDFMFACRLYELSDDFVENIEHEFRHNIRRIRNHPSLVLWCGNNEIEWGLDDQWIPDNEDIRKEYLRLFNEIIPDILKEEDQNTFYWPSSPSAKGDFVEPNCDNIGDMHYWGVWHNTEPFTNYRKYYPRFMSEFGLQSFPSLKTVETFTLPEDRNIFSPVMENHQKNSTCNGKILHYISENFRYPKDFNSLLIVSQLIQAEGIKYGVEHWRRNRGRCMGAIYWQLNDCWPVASWSSIDYYGRWKALHYAAKRFYAPILISACEEGTKVEIHLTNESFNKVKGEIIWRLRDTGGEIIKERTIESELEALSSKCFEKLDFEKELSSTELCRRTYLEFQFVNQGEVLSSGTVLFVKAKHFTFIDPRLKFNIEEKNEEFIINITAESFAKFANIDLKDTDAVFQDNYFDLSPDVNKKITLSKNSISRKLNMEELKEQIILRSLIDTYR